MKLLEMFSGTGSVGKVAKEFGFHVVSLDLKNADINCNILQWDYNSIQWVILISSMLPHHAQNIVGLKQ